MHKSSSPNFVSSRSAHKHTHTAYASCPLASSHFNHNRARSFFLLLLYLNWSQASKIENSMCLQLPKMDAEFAFRLLLLSARDLAYKLCFVSCKEIKSLRIRNVHAQALSGIGIGIRIGIVGFCLCICIGRGN